ncbi:hypothetical protein [Microbacterium sp.]|uniref:hypothetical protein n=1 Tax=Microbacterium sp. TaxID=51671 RepID=UPI003C72B07C
MMRRAKRPNPGRPPRKRLVSDAAVLEALTEGLGRLPEPTPQQRIAAKKHAIRFDRWMARGVAAWDALSPADRQREADRMLAGIRRYDRDADDRDLGPDGGRLMYGMHFAIDRDEARRRKRAAKKSASPSIFVAAPVEPEDVTAEAVRPAPASEESPVVDELAERRKGRGGRLQRRTVAGLHSLYDPATGRYIDPSFIDDDDFED